VGGSGGLDLLDVAFEMTRSGMALLDASGQVLRVNAAGAALVGRRPEELIGHRIDQIAHLEDASLALAALEQVVTTGHAGPVEVRAMLPGGDAVWLRCTGTLLPGEPPAAFLVVEDAGPARAVAEALARTTAELQAEHAKLVDAEAASARRAAQQAAVAQLGTLALAGAPLGDVAERCRKLVEATLGAAHCGVLVDDDHPDGLLLVASSSALTPEVSGFRYPTDAGLRTVFDAEGSVLVADLTQERRFTPNASVVAAGIRSMAATPIEPATGGHGVLAAGAHGIDAFRADDVVFLEAMANVLASAIDAKRALEELRHDALHDPLTGLPNRVLVVDRLELALAQASGKGTRVAVLVCDVDRFKVVNDRFGHAAGDDVLRVVAERLTAQVRPGDTVGRFGGDEFVIVCPDVRQLDSVVAIAERLGTTFAAPVPVGGDSVVATASIGIAVGEHSGAAAAAALLRDADAAMYRAKDRGRARYELFDESMRDWWTRTRA
jgi:diguanylate cyclase (GGDEF)-like protein/PAS domain S-box-containing protein